MRALSPARTLLRGYGHGRIADRMLCDGLDQPEKRARAEEIQTGQPPLYHPEMVEKHAGWTLVVVSLLPPPFPFTAFVAAAAAFRYPRYKILGFVGVGRFMRVVIEGALAIHYGRWIIKQAESPLLHHVMIALIVISIVGSVFSFYRW